MHCLICMPSGLQPSGLWHTYQTNHCTHVITYNRYCTLNINIKRLHQAVFAQKCRIMANIAPLINYRKHRFLTSFKLPFTLKVRHTFYYTITAIDKGILLLTILFTAAAITARDLPLLNRVQIITLA